MPAIITSKFRFHNAEQFKESFSEAAPTNYYMFIGRPSAFSTSGTNPETLTGGSDAAPPTPVDNRRTEAYQWDDMMAAKKIDSTGVTHAIPRRDLDTSGATKYDMYRPDYSASKPATSGATNLHDSLFYFVTSTYRVYKVLDNAVNGTAANWGAASEAVPSGDPTSGVVTTGNYKIKYMYTMSTTDVQNFLTPDFVSAPTAAESGIALADGSLQIVKITTAGTTTGVGSTSDRIVYNVPIRGDGSGALASVTIGGTGGSSSGQVVGVAVTAAGSGYTHATILSADLKEQFDLQYGTLTVSAAPVFEVIIGPDGGHGSNPAKELGGHFCMMDVKLQQTETFDFSVVNDFRTIGVVRNPYTFGTTSAYTSTSARQTKAIKLTGSTSGTFQVDEKISQALGTPTVSTCAVSGNTITVTTSSAHGFATGQLVTIAGSAFASGVTNGHHGTHHITVTSTTAFTFTVGDNRKPTTSASPPNATGTTTCVPKVPQGTVVEFDSGNNVLFYIQTPYLDQGTSSTGEKIPFSGNFTITGATSNATGAADTSYSSALNNTSFTSGYANPEMQPDSGDIIYIENRKPISRASDQTEDIKLIVEF